MNKKRPRTRNTKSKVHNKISLTEHNFFVYSNYTKFKQKKQ